MTKQHQADLWLVLITGFWGCSYVLTDLCLNEMPPMGLNAFRFLLAFVILGIIFFKRLFRLNRATLKYSILVGLALAGTYIFYGYGVSRTSLSNAGFICALPVVFTPVLDFIIHGKRPQKKLVLCIMLCTIGLALLTLNEQLRPQSGDILCLCVALCYAIDMLLTEKAVHCRDVDPVALGICELGVVGILTLIMSLLIEQPCLPQTSAIWAGALFLGIFCTGLAFLIQTIQQQYTTASHVGLIFTLEPVFSAIVAFIFVHEVLRPQGYLGAALMLLSLVLMELDCTGKS